MAQLLYSQSSIALKSFEGHEQVKYAFITSLTNVKSFGILKIYVNVWSRNCICMKVYILLAMWCEILHSVRGVWRSVSAKKIFTCLLMHHYNFTILVLVALKFSTEQALVGAWEFCFWLTSERLLE